MVNCQNGLVSLVSLYSLYVVLIIWLLDTRVNKLLNSPYSSPETKCRTIFENRGWCVIEATFCNVLFKPRFLRNTLARLDNSKGVKMLLEESTRQVSLVSPSSLFQHYVDFCWLFPQTRCAISKRHAYRVLEAKKNHQHWECCFLPWHALKSRRAWWEIGEWGHGGHGRESYGYVITLLSE